MMLMIALALILVREELQRRRAKRFWSLTDLDDEKTNAKLKALGLGGLLSDDPIVLTAEQFNQFLHESRETCRRLFPLYEGEAT